MEDYEQFETEKNKIREKIGEIRGRIEIAAAKSGRKGKDITLLAATKTRTAAEIRAAVEAGIDAAGENRVQELIAKYGDGAYCGVPLHFIGSLQTNKAKYLVGKVCLIHSVNSEKLGTTIAKFSERQNLVTDILIEVNIGKEENKSGIMPEQAAELCERLWNCGGIRTRGLMAIPPVSEPEEARKYFSAMRELFLKLRANAPEGFDILSMGMSEDYDVAVEEGATIVRVGRGIFGERRPG